MQLFALTRCLQNAIIGRRPTLGQWRHPMADAVPQQQDLKQLSTGAVLTITTGIVMVERFEGVPEAFEWVMGHPVWTHEMPRFGDEARDRIVAQHPGIPVAATSENWRAVLADSVQRFGRTIAIAQGNAARGAGPMSTLAEAVADAATSQDVAP
jgi:hypothetical protein